MNEKHFYTDLNEEQLDEIQHKYALLEPLLDEYLSTEEKKQHVEAVCQSLQISERTLRRYLQHFREEGIHRLIRRKRSDAGKMRVCSEEILQKAQQLLQQNSRRSVPMLMELLQADEQVGEQVRSLSASTLYYHLKQAGHEFSGRGSDPPCPSGKRA